MQITFTYNKKKVIQALRHYFIMRREIRVLIILVNVFSILAATLFFTHKISPLAFLVSAAMWLLLLIMFWFTMPYTVYKRTMAFKEQFTAIFNIDDLELKNEKGLVQWKWKNFINYKENPHFFFLYLSSRSFFLIPKDGLNMTQVIDIQSLLREKIPKG